MKGPKTYHLQEIWEWYALKVLAANPEWWGVYKDPVQNATIYSKYYDEKGRRCVIEMMSYAKFREAMSLLFELAKEAIIDGEVFSFKSKIGRIRVRRIEIDHSRKRVDFYKTNMRPKVWNEEKQKLVPSKVICYTDDDYNKVGWHKNGGFLKNLVLYEFIPTKNLSSGKGFNQMLHKANRENPILKYKYLFYPLKKRK